MYAEIAFYQLCVDQTNPLYFLKYNYTNCATCTDGCHGNLVTLQNVASRPSAAQYNKMSSYPLPLMNDAQVSLCLRQENVITLMLQSL